MGEREGDKKPPKEQPREDESETKRGNPVCLCVNAYGYILFSAMKTAICELSLFLGAFKDRADINNESRDLPKSNTLYIYGERKKKNFTAKSRPTTVLIE